MRPVAIGTSLTVQPAASLCGYAQRAGARLVSATRKRLLWTIEADAALRGSIGEVLPRLVGGAK